MHLKKRLGRVGIVLGVVVLTAGLTACEPTVLSVKTTPGLFPGFSSSVVDYVNRCDPATPTNVAIEAPSDTTVSVAGSAPRSGTFTVPVSQAVGRRFTIQITKSGATKTHHVRCIPADFPNWSVERTGTPQAQFYAVRFIGEHYSAVFDTNGVPVHWKQDASGAALFTPLPNKNLATVDQNGLTERRLDGSVVRTVNTVGPVDNHDVVLLPNGNYVMATAQNQPCDLSSWGLTVLETCINHVFQELTPAGVPVWTWDTATHIPVTETPPYWRQEELADRTGIVPTPDLYDPWHWNSVEYTGDGFIMSFRHLDALYKVNQLSGAVEWKLGGTPRAGSLTLVDDPLGGPAGQHDARLLADGTVTLHDNGNGRGRPARMTGYQVDLEEMTATLVEQVRDPAAPSAFCCGSTRVLPRGNWVIGWGGNTTITENRPDGTRVFRITIPGLVYRGVPIPPSQYTPTQFRAGMDAQYGS